MTVFFPVVIAAIKLEYILLPGGALIILAALWFVLHSVRKHYARRHIWPSGIEVQNGMNEREAARHMQETGRRHSSVRLSRNTVISRIHWSIYLNLKFMRHQLSKVPADIILMIPASLWLFDNFYLLYKQVKKVQETGGTSRFRKLPVLTNGPGKNYPRIYALAREIVASCNGHISEDLLFSMLEEYQKEQKLTTAELWAFQNVLSLCLLEKIIVESRKIIANINIKKSAASQLKKIMPLILKKDKRISELLRNTFTAEQTRNHAFLAHIIIQLRALSIEDAELDAWLQTTTRVDDNVFADRLSEIVNQEGQAEAASETAISILISSLKTVGDLNWEELFQKVSALDAVLCEDPADVFRQMDSETKGLYRAVIEKLSRKHHLDESIIARKVVQLASPDTDQTDQTRKSHVGYYLSGKGFYALLDDLSGSGSTRQLLDKATRFIRGFCYFTGILAITGGLLFVCWLLMREAPEIERWVIGLLLLILVMPCSDLASFLMNRIFSRLIRTQPLPGMDYTKEIPEACTTFVVMPVITDDPEQIRTFARRLEKHFLANRQKNIYYALLADYHDAASETTIVDDVILSAGTEAINTLNETYPETKNRFYLFFRPRKWNQAQGCWMGWERKRGKLESFNAYLCGEQNSGIDLVVGNRELMPDIRYVITLDADTELLRDGAAQLIGIMAHPMNKPVYDHQKNRITEGYAIVQSEIRTRILAHSTSLFARFFSGQTGIDPYASLVSDVYQDLFEEGIYVGKGIYDLQVFHQFLHGAIPENSVLSHDLLEGSLSRCAFASGIKLMDRCPESVAAYAKREHRWMRGDWQLLPWIFSRSSINGLSRWKMIDNLRRSLVKPAILLLLIGNALLVPQQIWFGLFFISYEPVYRILTLIFSAMWQKLRNPTVRLARITIIEQISIILAQAFFNIVLLPYRSYLAIDASIRTVYRVLISHKHLLEWQTAEAAEKRQINKQGQYWRLMWMSLIPAAILSIAVIDLFPAASMVFWLVMALLWVISPWIAWVISLRKPIRSRQSASINQVDDLRLTARRTWRYFEEQRTIENHWLCPDNIQLHPGPVASLKTSPTNIGLQLLATLTARDFGYIGLLSLVEHCEQVIDTILSLPRWHGHLYNWYNIRTLQVLHPRYVSTVDSGNFVVHLIALKQGLLQQKTDDIIHAGCILGLNDTCRLAGWSKDELPDEMDETEQWTSHLEAMKKARPAEGAVDDEWLLTVQNTCEDFQKDIKKLKLAGSLAGQSSLLALSQAGNEAARSLIMRIDHLTAAIDRIEQAVDFSVLYDAKFQLFSIGYNVASQTADSGHYDLFASEARVASFIAIARSEVPQKHWFVLGRPLTMVKGIPACVSWSGSMFEYLMPNLIMKTPQGTVMQQSCKAAVIQQIAYARRLKIPWGISESQYYRFDTNSNYQYSAFGIPRLRLQASLRPAKTVAPYATMLALAVLPGQSLDNLTRLRSLGAEGKYGFYEALDFNQPDAGRLESFSVVRSFMTHHQGMSFVAINNFLNRNIMRYRFHRDPVVQSAETLLEEKRTSITVTLASRGYTINIDASNIVNEKTESRICVKTNLIQPLVHILSNARYMVMLTSDGAGLSRYDDLLITRWQPETIHNQSGTFIYVRHLAAHQKWSTGYLPTQTEPDDYQVEFSHDRAEYTRRDGSIQTHTNITVSPIRNCEIRRITLTNHGSQAADIELTSYLEVVADDYMADTSHPSFSKLFIETEYIADRSLLIACRRKRSPEDQPRFVMHAVLPESKLLRPVEFEIDRLHFIGRGGSLAEPAVISSDIVMQNQAGFSRDTILSLRAVVAVPAGRSVSLSFVTGFCDSRADAMRLSHELSKPFSAVDTFALALASGKLELKYLNISSRQLNAILNLSSYLFYPDLATRGSTEIISRLKLGQSGLWRYSISGDHPIILLRVSELKELPVVQDVLLAYEYLRVKQVRLELVIMIEEPAGYFQTLEQRIREMTGNLKIYNQNQQKPSLFLLQKTYLEEEEYDLLIAVSRLVLTGRTGLYGLTFRQNPQARETAADINADAIILPAGDDRNISFQDNAPVFDYANLEFYNGIGGFAQNGQEYEIHLSYGRKTPMPWINVIANDSMGFLISEIGAGYTWVGNSRENKLTTWSNDPVLDPVSEAIYIRDDVSGGITSPTAMIPGCKGNYKVRHGFGYSVFEHNELALDQTMTVFVPVDDPVKLWLLAIKNLSGQKRSLVITLSVEWVLGVVRSQTAPYIHSAFHPDSELLTANNLYNDAHRTHPAYVFSSETICSYSGDRKTFFGIGGSIRYPSGLARKNLQNDTGIGLDPCAIIQIRLQIEPGATKELVFGMGQAEQIEQAAAIAEKYRRIVVVTNELKRVRDVWADRLGSITITTPDRAMDLLANGWLQYQVISCRIMARAAFYQCGGAIGFRDQLQDVLALLDTDPERVRQQILICCSRQFVEGDVQHWWHQDSGLGVRTRISDDLLWLPYVTSAYITQTGDRGILDIDVHFITGDQLEEDQAEMMSRPQVAREQASVYQHCLRAIDRASHMGKHGLPLMGGGDWNDGMNRVGIGGKGESVWLGWFLYSVLQQFIPVMHEQGDVISSQQMTNLADDLLSSIERNAWDGEWYLRAYFDDGTPLGSSASIECRIDSISQSWSVLSDGASHIRALTALDSARRHLVREADGVSLLLAPPFDKSDYDPGYIKGYYPGIRENGGQYTHGAIWLAMAYAHVGKGYDASELLTMLNPIHATASIMAVNKYEKEPYVMAADISMGGGYTGKAGWSWYTGSAGWMYQAIVHSFLGIVRKKDRLFIHPAVPLTYKRYVVEYRFGASLYEITVLIDQQNNYLTMDGQLVDDDSIQLTDDGLIHNVVCQINSGS